MVHVHLRSTARSSRTAAVAGTVLALAVLLLGLTRVPASEPGAVEPSRAPITTESAGQPSANSTPGPSGPATTYGEGGAGPHQESGSGQFGELSPAGAVAIGVVVLGVAAVLVTLALRRRRRRSAEGHVAVR